MCVHSLCTRCDARYTYVIHEYNLKITLDKPSLRVEEPENIPALARADDNNDDVIGCRDVDAPPDDLDDWMRSSFAATSSA